jgi:DNA-binding response OmpR family regulator
MNETQKILIVDDDAIIVSLISKILKSQGYSVSTARTGRDALAKVNSSYYNLVLLDIGLPDMMGTKLLERIRSSNNNIIVIMITGQPRLESSIDSINLGADGYLVKPINNIELLGLIERKLTQRFECWVNNIFI